MVRQKEIEESGGAVEPCDKIRKGKYEKNTKPKKKKHFHLRKQITTMKKGDKIIHFSKLTCQKTE